jgi:16S rRNA (uracil1498-N3)-methyltransferase
LAVGEFFPAILPNGEETIIKIISIDKNLLTGIISNPSSSSQVNPPRIILFQALPKADKMDLIVRQAAEAGVAEIVPFVSEHSVGAKGSGRKAASKREAEVSAQKFTRWQRIIKEARQQSGSKIATSICRPMTINELINYWKKINKAGIIGILLHHEGLEQKSLHCYLNNIPNVVTLVIGPEGGFSNTEVSLFLENGFKPFIIGDTILRTETAALYFTAAIKTLLWEKDSWELKQAKESSG